MTSWFTAYEERFGDSAFGNDAIGLFALGLQYGIEDLEAVGAESVVGGSDDKKCDLVHLDTEEGRCVIAQCYVSSKKRANAPANKASDLNTALTWLLNTPIRQLPAGLRGQAGEIRAAVKDGSLKELIIWYVHNLPESKNVASEMSAVEHTADAAIKNIKSTADVRISAREIGTNQFDRMYSESGSPIIVNETIRATVPQGYRIRGKGWNAYQTYFAGKIHI